MASNLSPRAWKKASKEAKREARSGHEDKARKQPSLEAIKKVSKQTCT